MLSLLVWFCAALFLAYGLTPLVIRGAHRAGILDVPTDDRRAHSVPIPRLGGIAVLAAISVTWLGISIVAGAPWSPFASQHGNLLGGLAIGTALVFAAGLFDDVRGLSPRFKLFVQFAAALVVASYGLRPSSIGIAPNNMVWNAGEVLGTSVLMLWIVGVTNAFNLIDGLDGLASGFAVVAAITVMYSSILIGAGLSPIMPAILAGAVLGFLRYNWNPARIFLGDAGSMSIGFIFAVLAVVAATDKNGITYPIISLLALAFPITDTLVAIARRWMRGVSFSQADGRHIHHQLRGFGFTVSGTVKILLATFSFVAGVGLILVFAPPRPTLALLLIGFSIPFATVIFGLRWLQYNEFAEFGSSFRSLIRHARQVVRIKIYANEAKLRIEQARSLSEITDILDTLAIQVGLLDIQLIQPNQKERLTPPSQQIAPLHALPMHLDYSFALNDSTMARVVVRLWDRPDPANKPHTMERVITRIGKALNLWYNKHITHATVPISDQQGRKSTST